MLLGQPPDPREQVQATTAIVEKTVRAFYSTMAVVCCNQGTQHLNRTSEALHTICEVIS